MSELNIISCGASYKHKKGFKFTQSTWPDCWLYTFFETDFISTTKFGMQKARQYSFILHEPKSEVWHTGIEDSSVGFTNDWMYFKGTYAENLIRKLNIPSNIIIQTRLGDYSAEIIRTIQHELSVTSKFKEEKIKALFTLLFVELSRAVIENTQIETKKNFTIHETKDTMLNNYQYRWTIQELAALSGYSPSHFSNLYKAAFETSPMEDLLSYRLTQARFMLESNSLSINEIALKCGFHSIHYFSRIFKSKNGISPLQYKQMIHNMQS